MRFIHTADWHLGNRFHEIDRTEETKAFFEWLKNQIEEKQAQALIVSGDIFDVTNPSSEAQSLFYTFLASMKNSVCKNIIITGGNHDSAQRLEIAKDLAALNNIHIVGSINNLKPEDMVFELLDSENKACGIAAAVPFAREIELQSYLKDNEQAEENCNEAQNTKSFSDRTFGALYEQVFKAAEKLRAGREIPVIAMGHLYAADLEGRLAYADSREKTDDGVKVIDPVGNLGNVHSEIFPKGFDYVALGHIHYTTMVAKNPSIRYSGSPFILGFDEAALPKYVLCVDVNYSKPSELPEYPEVEKLKVPEFINFKRISGSLEEIKQSLQKLSGQSFTKKLYVDLCYK